MRNSRRVLSLALLSVLVAAFAPSLSTPRATASPVHVLPLHSGAVDPAMDLASEDPVGHDIVLVQFDQRGATDVVDALPTTGATLLQPLAPVSYLVWADGAATQRIRALDGVRFAGTLPAEARVNPTVSGTALLRVTVVGDGGSLLDRATATTRRGFTGTDGRVLTVPGDATTAALLAQRPEVYSVAATSALAGSEALRDERTAAIVGEGLADPTSPYEPDDQFGVDGSGVTVAVVDGGVDTTHPELPGITDPRPVTCTSYTPGTGAQCDAGNSDDVIGHGTHVAGIVLGSGSTEIGDGGLGGYAFGHGVAPGASLHVQNAISLTAFRPSITDLFADSVRSGATVAQNSWGPSDTPQGYDEPTRQADAAVRDADPDEPGDQQLGVVFSIMNGNGGTSTQGAPDEAKNILAIGGSKSGRPSSGGSGDDLCSCSAHGPNLDGSRLVDLVAPGQAVMSTAAAQGVLCGVPSTEFPSPIHGQCTGTSMASPHVSGAYALFTEAYRTASPDAGDPSPALVKAALVNSAIDLARVGPVPGNDADGVPLTPVPNEQQGWGRLHVGAALDQLQDGTAIHVEQERLFDASGEVAEFAVDVLDPSQPLRVTLAYTDAFGHGEGGELRSLVNDLDLEVVAPDGTTYLGNVFDGGQSVPGGQRDTLNNLENVWFDAAAPGTWTIRVRATEIIGDGVPSSGDATDQDFALVVSNAN